MTITIKPRFARGAFSKPRKPKPADSPAPATVVSEISERVIRISGRSKPAAPAAEPAAKENSELKSAIALGHTLPAGRPVDSNPSPRAGVSRGVPLSETRFASAPVAMFQSNPIRNP